MKLRGKIGQYLRKRRRFLDITQTELGKKLKISPGFISEVEAGKKGLPLDTFLEWAEYLKIDFVLLPTEENE